MVAMGNTYPLRIPPPCTPSAYPVRIPLRIPPLRTPPHTPSAYPLHIPPPRTPSTYPLRVPPPRTPSAYPLRVPEWIWLVNVPTTANQIAGIEKANYHKILIFFPTTSLKSLHAARIDQLADSNEPAKIGKSVKLSNIRDLPGNSSFPSFSAYPTCSRWDEDRTHFSSWFSAMEM